MRGHVSDSEAFGALQAIALLLHARNATTQVKTFSEKQTNIDLDSNKMEFLSEKHKKIKPYMICVIKLCERYPNSSTKCRQEQQ